MEIEKEQRLEKPEHLQTYSRLYRWSVTISRYWLLIVRKRSLQVEYLLVSSLQMEFAVHI